MSNSGRAEGQDEAFTPLVSVVMPVRDRAHCVARAIDGVLAQTYRNFELIVVDDGSSDATADVVAGYADAVTLIREAASGPYQARNRGIALAKGEIIALADSDDVWLPHKLEAQVPLLRRPEVALVFGDTVIEGDLRAAAWPAAATGFRASPPRRGRVAAALAWRNFVPTCTVLVRRSSLAKIGGFPARSQLSADYLVWLSIALQSEIDYVDAPVCTYRFTAEGISYDLGRSLAARIALFAGALEQNSDKAARRIFRRLLFNLSCHLALAAKRRAAASARTADRLAGGGARRPGLAWWLRRPPDLASRPEAGGMSQPLVSVVVETITARADVTTGALPEDLERTLTSLERQTWPRESIEPILVVDEEVADSDRSELARRWPGARLVSSPASNYFDAKNVGARAASAEFVALLDGDCAPADDWLERLMARMQPGVAAVAGRTRYTGETLGERIFSIPDFAYVVDRGDGRATGININNVVFRREVLLDNPFDTRIARNGGCYFLFHHLRAQDARILYAPDAGVSHGNDIAGFRFARKHFDRGYDSVTVYRLDETPVLRGTRLFRRFGPIALIGFSARQTVIDWIRLLRHRRQIGIRLWSLPFYCGVSTMLRSIELCGALTATVRRAPQG
jgi:glycosyltransferase involved in cell wall biosynthesis